MDLPVQNTSVTSPEELPQLPHTKPDGFIKVALFAALVACGMALYLFWQNQKLSYQLALSRQVSPTPATSIAPDSGADPTKDWKTFTNSELGFEFKYPMIFKIVQNDWQKIGSDQKGNWVLNLHSDNPKLDFMVDFRPNPRTANGRVLSKVADSIQGIDYKEVLFQGFQGIRYDSSNIGGMTSTSLNVLKQGSLWQIYLLNWPADENNIIFFDQILSTFKFTNNISSDISVKNYQGKYFSFSYPSDMKITETETTDPDDSNNKGVRVSAKNKKEEFIVSTDFLGGWGNNPCSFHSEKQVDGYTTQIFSFQLQVNGTEECQDYTDFVALINHANFDHPFPIMFELRALDGSYKDSSYFDKFLNTLVINKN